MGIFSFFSRSSSHRHYRDNHRGSDYYKRRHRSGSLIGSFLSNVFSKISRSSYHSHHHHSHHRRHRRSHSSFSLWS